MEKLCHQGNLAAGLDFGLISSTNSAPSGCLHAGISLLQLGHPAARSVPPGWLFSTKHSQLGPTFVCELVGKQCIFALGGEGEEPKHLGTWLSSAAGRTGGFLSLLAGHAVAAAVARQMLDTAGGGS